MARERAVSNSILRLYFSILHLLECRVGIICWRVTSRTDGGRTGGGQRNVARISADAIQKACYDEDAAHHQDANDGNAAVAAPADASRRRRLSVEADDVDLREEDRQRNEPVQQPGEREEGYRVGVRKLQKVLAPLTACRRRHAEAFPIHAVACPLPA